MMVREVERTGRADVARRARGDRFGWWRRAIRNARERAAAVGAVLARARDVMAIDVERARRIGSTRRARIDRFLRRPALIAAASGRGGDVSFGRGSGIADAAGGKQREHQVTVHVISISSTTTAEPMRALVDHG